MFLDGSVVASLIMTCRCRLLRLSFIFVVIQFASSITIVLVCIAHCLIITLELSVSLNQLRAFMTGIVDINDDLPCFVAATCECLHALHGWLARRCVGSSFCYTSCYLA